jgi:hypothetical protein
MTRPLLQWLVIPPFVQLCLLPLRWGGEYIKWMLKQLFLMERLRRRYIWNNHRVLKFITEQVMFVGSRRLFMDLSKHPECGIPELTIIYRVLVLLRVMQIQTVSSHE